MTWELGQTSRKYEVGSGNAGTVSTGRGDHGGVSYGLYQLSSKMGTCSRFVEDCGLGPYFEPYRPGEQAFTELWKMKARNEPKEFEKLQHKYIEKTHYVPQLEYLQDHDMDLSMRGPGVKDAIWSTSVQFGPRTSLIRKALAQYAKPVSEMTDEEIIKAIQGYKIANNNRLFRSSSPAVRRGTLNRAKRELKDLLALARLMTEEPEPEPISFPDVLASKPKATFKKPWYASFWSWFKTGFRS